MTKLQKYFVRLDDMNLNYVVECMPETDRCGFVTATTSRHLKLLSSKCAKIRTLSIFSENNYAPLDWNNNGFEAQEGHHLDSLVQDTNDGSPQCVISTGILVFFLKKSFFLCGSKLGIYVSIYPKAIIVFWKEYAVFDQKSNWFWLSKEETPKFWVRVTPLII